MTSVPLELPSGRQCNIFKPIQSSSASGTTSSTDLKPIKSSEVTIKTNDGQTIKAYLSVPDVETVPTTGIVMLSDIFGCDISKNREVADLFAKHSIPTIIPDLFRGDPWPEKPLDDTFMPWLETHPSDRVISDAIAAVKVLRELGYAKSIGVLGFCFGGGRVLDIIKSAENELNPDAAVSFYGTRFNGDIVGSQARTPLMYLIGREDPLIPMKEVDALRVALETKNTTMSDAEIIFVEKAGHAFAHRPRTEDDKTDHDIIMNKAIGWMQKFLKTD